MTIAPQTPPLSVIMTTFNGGPFIRQQLESLATQTLLPQELVVCDDGSTDDTLAIVAAFQRVAPFPVRIQRNAVRLGYADNFLHGCTLATGQLIAFCDQDDVWLPTKLARCVAALTADAGVLLAIHSATVVDGDLRPRGFAKPDFAAATVLPPSGGELDFSLPGFAMVFSRDLIRAATAADRAHDAMKAGRPLMAHDQWLVFLARCGGRVAHLPERLALYRQHGGNHCGATDTAAPGPTWQRAANEAAYRQRAEASEYYGKFLAGLAVRASGPWRHHLSDSAGHYRQQAQTYTARALLYAGDRTLPGRIGTYAALWMRGAYSSARGLGWRAGLKDAGALVLG
jgi:glycosyltransferase involved in cell wall biosynthesis